MSATAEQATPLKIEHVSPDTPVEEILALFWRDRAVIIDDLAEPDELATLRVELEGPLNATPMSARDDEFLGKKTKRCSSLVADVPTSHGFIMHPLILELMQGIIGRNCTIQLNTTQAMAVQPGETRQALHRDRWLWECLKLNWDKYEYMVNCMWAVSEFTAENGATHMIPGSAALPNPKNLNDVLASKESPMPDGRLLQEIETVQAEMPPGSVFLWGGSIYHGAGANHSDSPRLGMALSYIPSVLRQEENQYLVVPPEIARELPEEMQKLIGYELANYVLGFVQYMKSPMSLLR